MIWLGKDAKRHEIRNALNAIWEASENLRTWRHSIYTVASNSSVTAQPHITVQPVTYLSNANTQTSTTAEPTTWTTWAEWVAQPSMLIVENPL